MTGGGAVIVIDASVTGPMLLPDEKPLSDDLSDQLAAGQLLAPAHWPSEVANLLLMAERRGRVSADHRLAALREVQGWGIQLDVDTAARVWRHTADLAVRHGLTIYDAAYLELAQRRGVALAARDRPLLDAARGLGVEILSDL